MRTALTSLFCIFILLISTTITQDASALLKLDITKGNVAPLPIAIPKFGGDSFFSNKVRAVIAADLKRSGLFENINPRAFIQKISGVATKPRFADWRKISAQALITASVTTKNNGDVVLEFRLWDVFSGKQIIGQKFSSSKDGWRRIAHKAADVIYSRLTGEKGYFDSRIVYVAESGVWNKRTKRLAIMDSDGFGTQYLTTGQDMALTPRFDPNSQRIIYMAYHGRKPHVYLYNLATGHEELLGSFKSMTFAPRFSPDGKNAIFSAATGGSSRIAVIDLLSRKSKYLTNGRAIDTSPSYSPDNQHIVFNSDRSGAQQLYTMDKNGGDVKRISFGKGSYATPVWSPRGDLIAFTRMYGGQFYIGVMRPDGSGERLLTESFLDEGPTWSPNGRVIIFTRQTRGTASKQGVPHLYSIDLTGYNERRINTPTAASDPAWSPLLSKR